MDDLPPEVLHLICVKLSWIDVANFRLVGKKFAEVGAHHLISTIRFHTSLNSLNRLRQFAQHPIFSKTITDVVYERSLIANVGCVHSYTRHFESESHHANDRPKPLVKNATPREQRLYERSKNKFDMAVKAGFKRYSDLREEQLHLMGPGSHQFRELLDRSLSSLAKITSIEFSTVGECYHVTSKRFNEEFGAKCEVPMSYDSYESVWQLQFLLFPDTPVSGNLRTLKIHHLNPKFFSEVSASRAQIMAMFAHLTKIELDFKIAIEDFPIVHNGAHLSPQDSLQTHLSSSLLKDALVAAQKVEELSIGIMEDGFCIIKQSDLFADESVWPRLCHLRLYSFEASVSDFVPMLCRQPNLKNLQMSSPVLSHGVWPDITDQMRERLKLDDCDFVDSIIDDTGEMPLCLVHQGKYMTDKALYSVSQAINDYVCHKSDDSMLTNPIHDIHEYEDEDYLHDSYGNFDSMEGLSDDDDDDDDEDFMNVVTDHDSEWLASHPTFLN